MLHISLNADVNNMSAFLWGTLIMRIRNYIIVLILIGVFLTLYQLYINNSHDNNHIEPIQQSLLTGPGSETLSFGLYDPNGNIHSDGVLDVVDESIKKIFSMSNYYSDKKDFKLIILIDFTPKDFQIDGLYYDDYDFSLDVNASIQIPLDIHIPDGTEEISFIVFEEPYADIDSIHTAISLQELNYLRFKIESSKSIFKSNSVTLQPIHKTTEGPFEAIFLSDSSDSLTLMLHAKGKSQAYLHVSNPTSDRLHYVIVAVADWNEVPIRGNVKNFLSVEPNNRNVYKLEFPNFSETNTPYQVLAFPYTHSSNDRLNQAIFTTTRIGVN